MAFTKVLGPGIHTLSNITSHNINSSGIVTAVSFVGDGSGLTGVASTDSIITGTAATFNTYPVDINAGMTVAGVATFSGNLTVGGVLTYEDVKNVDSIGVVTARNGIDCNGDIDVDGHTNLDNVSVAGIITSSSDIDLISNDAQLLLEYPGRTKGHLTANYYNRIILSSNSPSSDIVFGYTQYGGDSSSFSNPPIQVVKIDNGDKSLEIGNQYHGIGVGATINGLTGNATFTGIVTATGADINGDLDVDGHTNLDNVSIAGVTTSHDITIEDISPRLQFFDTNADANEKKWDFKCGSNNEFIIQGINDAGSGGGHLFKMTRVSNSNGIDTFEAQKSGTTWLTISNEDRKLTTRDLDVTNNLDVDGHTNLDNVSVAGVTTFSDNLRIIDGKKIQLGTSQDLEIYHSSNNSVVKNKTGNLTFMTTDSGEFAARFIQHGAVELYHDHVKRFETSSVGVSIPQDLDVDGHTNLDNVSVAGVSTVSTFLQVLGPGGTSDRGFEVRSTASQTTDTNQAIRVRNNSNTDTFKVSYKGKVEAQGQIQSTYNHASLPRLYLSGISGSSGYNYLLRGDNDAGSRAVHFVNGSARSADNGANTYTIRNDNGKLHLGKTNQLAVLQGSTTYLQHGSSTKLQTSSTGVTVTGTVDATSFTGDGSNLTGITQTTINNNANNRVITGSGTANTLEAEAALTFYNSGSDPILTLSNSGHAQLTLTNTSGSDHCGVNFGDSSDHNAGMIQYSNNGDFMVFHTAGGERLRITSDGKVLIGDGSTYNPQGLLHIVGDNNSNGPELYLQVNNNNTTDNIGALLFGNNVDKSIVKIQGVTHTANNTGDLTFHTSTTGTMTEKLRITSGGRVQIPDGGDLYVVGSSYNAKLNGNILTFDRAGYSYIDQISNSGTLVFRVGASSANMLRLDIQNAYFPNGTLFLGTQNTSSGHLNAYENMSFNIDTDNDDTNRYFSFHTNGNSASGTELLRINEDGTLTQSSTKAFQIAKGSTSDRPSGVVGMVRFNTDTDQLENYTSAGWRNVNLKVPSITSISGEIYAGMPSNITINGNDFDATVTVIFKEGSTTRATLTGQSVSSGSLTVTVPSSVYGQSVGDTITITITNSDGVVSTGSNKTIQSTPTGGTVSSSGNYRIHTFTSSGTLTAPSGWSTSYDYLVVAGGGSGGNNKIGSFENGGGGGAGGMLTGSSTLSAGSYSISIGAGAAIPGGDGQTKGGNTTAFGLTAIGGGGGRTRDTSITNCNGGSGGGTTNWDDINSPGSGTSGQGNNGGTAGQQANGNGGSGGGGGKNGTGGTGSGNNGGNGGAGQASSISGSSVTYAGGGGGGGGNSGSGGSGGGGNSGNSSSINGSNGQTNRGGGGGGNYAPTGNAGNGGSGIVIVRYKLI